MRTAVLLASLCLGCGPSALAQAEARWQAATGAVIPEGVTVAEAETRHIPCGGLENAVGCTRGVAITLARDSAPYVLLHEVGHVLGARHHDGVGVMVPARDNVGWRDCLTLDDVESVPLARWRRPECELDSGWPE